MKLEYIKEQIHEFANAGNDIYAFYVGYKSSEGILSQHWGKMEELDEIFENMKKSKLYIQEELPIERLIIYAKTQCMVFFQNPFYNCVDDASEDSHIVDVCPYIAEDGFFGRIISEKQIPGLYDNK